MSSRNRKIDHKLKKLTTDDLVFRMHEYDIDTESNHIYLFGAQDLAIGTIAEDWGEPGIEFTIANRFIRNLNLCMKSNPDKTILIHMKTNGGYWTEGLAIRDAIKMCPSPTVILNYTHARSMTSMIFLAANKRVMMPHSYFLFHQGTMSYDGTERLFQTEARKCREYVEVMMNLYIDALKEQGSMKHWSRKRIYEWLDRKIKDDEDVYVEADEAVELGFADEIFDGNWARLVTCTQKQKDRDKTIP